MSTGPVTSAEAVSFQYPRGDFTLSVGAFAAHGGEAVALVGPSGCGKSTFLNLLAGVLRPDSGHITLNGVELADLKEEKLRQLRARQVGFVFQDFGLLDYLSAHDNIIHPYRMSRALKLTAETRARAADLAARLGIDRLLDRPPGDLSFGERQRVAICRALLPKPQLLLADEATGNLDPLNKRAIVDLMVAAAHEDGAALVAVTHDHDLLPAFDRVVDFAELDPAS